ncbi:MAG: hypothetical protein WDO18_20570 [Acidobacteriota bacterium]
MSIVIRVKISRTWGYNVEGIDDLSRPANKPWGFARVWIEDAGRPSGSCVVKHCESGATYNEPYANSACPFFSLAATLAAQDTASDAPRRRRKSRCRHDYQNFLNFQCYGPGPWRAAHALRVPPPAAQGKQGGRGGGGRGGTPDRSTGTPEPVKVFDKPLLLRTDRVFDLGDHDIAGHYRYRHDL